MLVGYHDGYTRGNFEPGTRELEKALSLAQTLGAKRFEAQTFQMLAMIALRRGDRAQATALAGDALKVCREHGTSFTGAWLQGVIAGLAQEPAERERALAEGERLLAEGCVSHNHFNFYANAIDASLAGARWDLAGRYCAKLEAYAALEPLPWTEFVIARGDALARHGRGERSAELAEALKQLRAQAAQAEINNALPALDAAIAGFG
jgi:ATP/maltotriose-dependent transcriptional regulator MalT